MHGRPGAVTITITITTTTITQYHLAVRTCMAGQVPPQATPINALRKIKRRTFVKNCLGYFYLRGLNQSIILLYLISTYICSSCYRMEKHEDARKNCPNSIDLDFSVVCCWIWRHLTFLKPYSSASRPPRIWELTTSQHSWNNFTWVVM